MVVKEILNRNIAGTVSECPATASNAASITPNIRDKTIFVCVCARVCVCVRVSMSVCVFSACGSCLVGSQAFLTT